MFILLIDCSNLSQNECEYFKKNVDLFINCKDNEAITKKVFSENKSNGERSYLLYAFNIINQLRINNLENIFKLSGRYYLNETFSYDFYDNKDDIIKIVDFKLWQNAAVSCFFKIHINNIADFMQLLESYEQLFDSGISTEHFMYDYALKNKKNKSINNLGCSGKIAINGILGNT